MSIFFDKSLELSVSATETGGGPFGAVIVHNNTIVGRGKNSVIPNHDPTAHAEMCAIRESCRILKTHSLTDCQLYTSCEPCPMCLAACYWAGITEINYINTRKDAEEIGFTDKYIYDQFLLPHSEKSIKVIRTKDKDIRYKAKEIFTNWKGKKY